MGRGRAASMPDCWSIAERALQADHPYRGAVLHNLSELERLRGRHAEAESLCARSQRVWETRRMTEHTLAAACERQPGRDLPGAGPAGQGRGRVHAAPWRYARSSSCPTTPISPRASGPAPPSSRPPVATSRLARWRSGPIPSSSTTGSTGPTNRSLHDLSPAREYRSALGRDTILPVGAVPTGVLADAARAGADRLHRVLHRHGPGLPLHGEDGNSQGYIRGKPAADGWAALPPGRPIRRGRAMLPECSPCDPRGAPRPRSRHRGRPSSTAWH